MKENPRVLDYLHKCWKIELHNRGKKVAGGENDPSGSNKTKADAGKAAATSEKSAEVPAGAAGLSEEIDPIGRAQSAKAVSEMLADMNEIDTIYENVAVFSSVLNPG